MSVDWRGLTLGLMCTLGGALMGYAYGHHEGEQESTATQTRGKSWRTWSHARTRHTAHKAKW